VLDAADAGLHCRHRAFFAVRVRLDGNVPGRSFLHDRADFVFGVDLLARVGIRCSRSLGCEDLDPVDPVRQVHPNRPAHRVERCDASHQIRVLGIVEKRFRSGLWTHVVPRGDDIRPGSEAPLHELVEAKVHIVRHARAANGRHTRFESAAERGEIRRVRVRVDEAGQQVLAFQIECRHARGRRRCSDRFDPPVPQDDRCVAGDSPVAHVHDVGVHERQWRCGRRWCRRLR
jgi:hypothetical protein